MSTPTKVFLTLFLSCFSGYMAYTWATGERALPNDFRDSAASVMAPPPTSPQPQPVILTASIGLPFKGPMPMPPAISETRAR